MKFEIWGLTGTLTTEHEAQMDEATNRLWYWLDAVDASCNRFHDDSELSQLNECHGETVAISPTLELALSAALRAAEVTGDLVDPTVLPALLALGYDRDFDELGHGDSILEHMAVPSMGPSAIHLDLDEHTVMLDPPCRLDLGASAKALETMRLFIDPDLKEITRYTLSYCAALTYVSIGQKDKAFEWLEKARIGRDASFPFLPHDPRFDPVKSDPRFKPLADSLTKPAVAGGPLS